MSRSSLSSRVPAAYPRWLGCCWKERGWGRCCSHCQLHHGVGITVTPVLMLSAGCEGSPALPCSCPWWGRGPSAASPAGVRGCAGGWGTRSCPLWHLPFGVSSRPAVQVMWWCWPRAGELHTMVLSLPVLCSSVFSFSSEVWHIVLEIKYKCILK